MKNKNFKLSTLKTWIARTPAGRKKLTERYSKYKKETNLIY
jgi:hypothetical protein